MKKGYREGYGEKTNFQAASTSNQSPPRQKNTSQITQHSPPATSIHRATHDGTFFSPTDLLLLEGRKNLGLELVGDTHARMAVGAGLGSCLLLVIDVLVVGRLLRLDGVTRSTSANVVVLLGGGAVGLLGDEILVGARGGRGFHIANISGP